MFGIARQAHERRHVDVDAGAAGHVVDDDRQRRALGDRAVVLEQPFRRRLVVVRRHREQALRAGLLHLVRELDHLRGVVAAGAGQHRHLAVRFVDENLDDAKALGDA